MYRTPIIGASYSEGDTTGYENNRIEFLKTLPESGPLACTLSYIFRIPSFCVEQWGGPTRWASLPHREVLYHPFPLKGLHLARDYYMI